MNINIVALIVFLLVGLVAGLLFAPGQSLTPDPSPVTRSQAAEDLAAVPIEVTIYKSPTCGCCGSYEQYLTENGFKVTSIPTDNMSDLKHRYGIPDDMLSCHTAVIGGYFVEGHVPVEAIEALLSQKPEIDGIALPGMPMGSPGMGGEKSEPFQIYSITDGVAELFMSL